MKTKKAPYLPLRAGLLIYDFFRLFIMLELLITALPLGNSPEAPWLPYLVYAAPNALFPLMGFFLVIRPQEYNAYIPLYQAGKIIVLVSIFGWIVFSCKTFLSFTIPTQELVAVLGLVLGLSLLDTGSLLGSSLLKNKINREWAPESGNIGEGDMISERGEGS